MNFQTFANHLCWVRTGSEHLEFRYQTGLTRKLKT